MNAPRNEGGLPAAGAAMTRKHYNDGFEGHPLEAGITWWPGEGQSIEASGEDCLQASSRSDESAVPAKQDAPNTLSTCNSTTIGERQAIAEGCGIFSAEVVQQATTIAKAAWDSVRPNGSAFWGELPDYIQTLAVVAARDALATPTTNAPVAAQTPAAEWRENGEPDPHGDSYNCERAKLCGGHLTDDQVAYETAMLMRSDLNHEAVLQTAKDRIRWLSRKLVEAQSTLPIHGEMREALEQAATWFEEYATAHYAKALTAPDSREQHGREVKGKTNRDRAAFLRNALQGDGL